MDFAYPPEADAYRAKVRSFLDTNLPKGWKGIGALNHADAAAFTEEWRKTLFANDMLAITWPKEYGGQGLGHIEALVQAEEFAKVGAPSGGPNDGFGIGMLGNTLLQVGTEEQRRHYLPRVLNGDDRWCQGYSEPSSGSDLGNLGCRAVLDGDEWVINGQKIWTSGAQHSDFGMILTRTDPSVAKHEGLTMFFLDMKAPGVEVRPIKQVNGQSGFNEVYFTDVRIPDHQRLGEVGNGWKVSLTTLMNERLSIGASMPTGFPELLDFCCTFDTGTGKAVDDPAVRSKLATWAVRTSGLKYTAYRSISALSKGQTPGPENSIGKLVAGSTLQEIAQFAMDLQGASGVLTGDAQTSAQARFQAMLLRSPATRIEGGTDEILRNIIAERVLGLPADLRADRGPFNQIPTRTR